MSAVIPSWLKEVAPATCPCCEIGRTKGFIDKTLDKITSFLKEIFVSEDFAMQDGIVQRIDSRIRILTFFILIFFASFLKSFIPLLAILSFIILITYMSHIPISALFKRTAPVIIFTGIIMLPSLFITDAGIKTTSLFVFRVAVIVSIAAILFLATRKTDLLKGLSMLFVPQIFVMTLAFAFRYIFIFLKLAENMHLARKSRIIKKVNTKESRAWTVSRLAVIFKRSAAMADDVYLALASRGFTGEIKTMENHEMQKRDYLWIGIVLFVMLITIRL
ncbi:MAG: hypothetical protein HZB79_03350 [Deltaproteobacteria bacterium]|nr:hypothetical protein [Deltaproteobacteria bacterium]